MKVNIKSIFKDKDKKVLLSNFISLFVLQGANYILPLITLPYLVRVLGAEKFGIIAFAQAFVAYFGILIGYGFELSATKEIAEHRENKEKVIEIFSSVILIKFLIMLFSLLVMSLIIFSFDNFKKNWLIFYFTFGVPIGRILFPVWFFQGMEKMKYITFLNITAKVIFTIFIFVFIREASDYIYVPLINSAGFFVAGIIAMWIIFRNFNMKFIIPPFKTIFYHFKNSTQFFLSRLSVSIYTSTNTFVLGLFTTHEMVGYYAVAEKLYQAFDQLYHPLVNTLYPYVANKKNISLFKKIFKIANLFNLILFIVVFLLAGEIIKIIFGDNLDYSVNVFKILILTLPIVVPSMLIGYPFLAAMGFPKYANNSVIFSSILHIIGLGILILLNLVNIYTVAFMVIITESFVLFYRLYGIFKEKLPLFTK